MFGFVIGTACLIGLLFVLRPNWHRRRAWTHGRRALLRRLFEKLDTTPGQEKVIRSSIEELFERTRDLKKDFAESKRAAANAIRGETLDDTSFSELFTQHDDILERFRQEAVGAMGRIHEVLDPKQRAKLADLLEKEHHMPFHGPYRTPAC